MRHARRGGTGLSPTLLAVLLAGGLPAASRGQEEPREDATIDVFRSDFIPPVVTILLRGTVTWKRRQSGEYEITSGSPGSPDAGELFRVRLDDENPQFSFRFEAPGNFFFFNSENPAAGLGNIVVTPDVKTHRVGVVDNAFIPEDLSIFAGDTVHWQHEPNEAFHTVTSGFDLGDPSWGDLFDEESSDLNPDFFYTFEETGLQPYFCKPHIHLGMVGTVTIQSRFIRGDFNFDGTVDIADAVRILFALFRGQGNNNCPDAADADDNGQVETADVVRILEYLFTGGTPPARPFGVPGPDRTEDSSLCLQ